MSFVRDKPWKVLADWSARYGGGDGMVAFNLLGKPQLLLAQPDLVRTVLEEEQSAYYKKNPVAALSPVLTADAAFVARTPDAWRPLVRTSLMHQLAADRAEGWLPSQVAPVRAQVERSQTAIAVGGAVRDVVPPFYRLAFDTFSVMLLGRTFRDQDFAALMEMARCSSKWMAAGPSFLKPSQTAPPFTTARETWWRAVSDCIAYARRDPHLAERTDLLAAALRSDLALTDRQLLIELSGAYFAGMFSGGMAAIVATLYELTRRPDVREPLVESLRAMDTTVPGWGTEELASSDLLEQVVRETLRVYPPVPIYMRNVVADRPAKLGGRQIPGDTTVWICNYAFHMSGHWADAERWEPSRWTAETRAANPYGGDWFFPYGRGPRACSGEGFADVYIKTALATILTRSTFEVGRGQPYDGSIFFTVVTPGNLRAGFSVVGS